ncbi:MAG: hypothetical protein FWE34_05540 [Defluviitaleaceae bacterium]|nr:hypothetical protein [Defluviitaleaceae bacterium]
MALRRRSDNRKGKHGQGNQSPFYSLSGNSASSLHRDGGNQGNIRSKSKNRSSHKGNEKHKKDREKDLARKGKKRVASEDFSAEATANLKDLKDAKQTTKNVNRGTKQKNHKNEPVSKAAKISYLRKKKAKKRKRRRSKEENYTLATAAVVAINQSFPDQSLETDLTNINPVEGIEKSTKRVRDIVCSADAATKGAEGLVVAAELLLQGGDKVLSKISKKVNKGDNQKESLAESAQSKKSSSAPRSVTDSPKNKETKPAKNKSNILHNRFLTNKKLKLKKPNSSDSLNTAQDPKRFSVAIGSLGKSPNFPQEKTIKLDNDDDKANKGGKFKRIAGATAKGTVKLVATGAKVTNSSLTSAGNAIGSGLTKDARDAYAPVMSILKISKSTLLAPHKAPKVIVTELGNNFKGYIPKDIKEVYAPVSSVMGSAVIVGKTVAKSAKTTKTTVRIAKRTVKGVVVVVKLTIKAVKLIKIAKLAVVVGKIAVKAAKVIVGVAVKAIKAIGVAIAGVIGVTAAIFAAVVVVVIAIVLLLVWVFSSSSPNAEPEDLLSYAQLIRELDDGVNANISYAQHNADEVNFIIDLTRPYPDIRLRTNITHHFALFMVLHDQDWQTTSNRNVEDDVIELWGMMHFLDIRWSEREDVSEERIYIDEYTYMMAQNL